MLMAMLARLAVRSAISVFSRRSRFAREPLKSVAGTLDLISDHGRVSTGERTTSKLRSRAWDAVLWRNGHQARAPVAMEFIGGTPFIGLPEIRCELLSPRHVVRPRCWRWRAPHNNISFQCRSAQPSLTKRKSRVANISGQSAQERKWCARSGQISTRGCRATVVVVDTEDWSNSRRKLRWRTSQTVGFLGYASLILNYWLFHAC